MASSRVIIVAGAIVAFAVVYAVADRQVSFEPGSAGSKSDPKPDGEAARRSQEPPVDLVREQSVRFQEAPNRQGESALDNSLTASKSAGYVDSATASGTEPAEMNMSGPVSRVDSSVVGHHFPLSESIRRTCAGLGKGEGECPELMAFLAAFSEEPRDLSWAAPIEQRITEFIAESKLGNTSVRTVECRTDRCVLEVQAPFEYSIIEFEKDPVLKEELREWIGDLGFEREAGQPEIVVTLATLYRRKRVR
jgi:hypothetical protein